MFAIEQRKRTLDLFFLRASAVSDDEIKADLAKLGAVLSCGFVERSVEIIVMERIHKRAQDRVRNFIKSHFKKGANYDCPAICSLLERFETKWADRMKEWMGKNPGPVESLVSVYGLRNSIAHGGGNTSSLTRIQNYYEDCKLVVDAMVQSTR